MIIYQDLISHDEMLRNPGGLCLEGEGKMVSRIVGNIDDLSIGENATPDDPKGEVSKSTVITGVDIVMNHHWQKTNLTK